MSVEREEPELGRGGVLAASGCGSSGNVFSEATFSCTTAAPCLISYMVRVGEDSSIWQGFSNQFSGDHSWVVTPGPFDRSDSNFNHSLYDATASIPADTWTWVQYTYPEEAHAGSHQWQLDGTTTEDFTNLRVMLQAAGPNCSSVRFDDFCVCGTTHDAGMTCVARAEQSAPSSTPSSASPTASPSWPPSRPLPPAPAPTEGLPSTVSPVDAPSQAAGAVCNGSPGADRDDCGASYSSADLCTSHGCCWSPVEDNPGDLPWCFRPAQEPACASTVEVAGREDCMGAGGPAGRDACAALGCCWSPVDPNPDNIPWCFLAAATTTLAPVAAPSRVVPSAVPPRSATATTAVSSAPPNTVQSISAQPTAGPSTPDGPPAQRSDIDDSMDDGAGNANGVMLPLLIVVAIVAVLLAALLVARLRVRGHDRDRAVTGKVRGGARREPGQPDTRINPAFDPTLSIPEGADAHGGSHGGVDAPEHGSGYLQVLAEEAFDPQKARQFDGTGNPIASPAAGGHGSSRLYSAYGKYTGVPGAFGAAGSTDYATVPTAAMGAVGTGHRNYSEPLSVDAAATAPATTSHGYYSMPLAADGSRKGDGGTYAMPLAADSTRSRPPLALIHETCSACPCGNVARACADAEVALFWIPPSLSPPPVAPTSVWS